MYKNKYATISNLFNTKNLKIFQLHLCMIRFDFDRVQIVSNLTVFDRFGDRLISLINKRRNLNFKIQTIKKYEKKFFTCLSQSL